MKSILIAFASIIFIDIVQFASSGKANACDSLSYRIGVTVRCEHPSTGESINCRKEKVPLGTVARYKCDDFYVTLDGDDIGGNMTCGEGGKWRPEHPFRAFTCNMDCGRQFGDNKWPWHAAIFKRNGESAPFKYSCGGTLLNPFNKGLVLLTSARCLNPSRELDSNYEVDPRNLKIALGLVTSEFAANIASAEVDVYPVKRIALNKQGEFALIKLGKEVTLKENVLPVCFSANKDLANEQIVEGSVAEFVGFGQAINSDGQFDVLRGINLGVLPGHYCTKYQSSKNNICAGHSEGSNICSGDNGGSLFFSSSSGYSRRRFVQGVYTHLISDARTHSCESYGEFSRLADFRDWIRDTAVGFYVDEDPHANPEFEIAFQRETPAPASPTQTLLRPIRPEYPFSPDIVGTTGQQIRTTEKYHPDIPISPLLKGQAPQSQRPGPGVVAVNPRDYELAALEWHNRYRAKHGVSPIVLISQLNREAQHEAEQSLRNKQFYSPNGFANWFALSGANLSPSDAAKEATKDWYKTSGSYNKNKPISSPFTTMVWKSGEGIGVGYAARGTDQVVVVKYKMANLFDANTKKGFDENVLPAIE